MDLERDADDWALALAGDERAFGRVYDRTRGSVRRQATRLLASRADADDAVAVTFLELWRRRESVRLVDGSVLPWLLVTAAYVARNLRRSSRRYRALLDRLPPSELTDDVDERSDLVAALRSLPLTDQQVLTLCVIEQWPERDAAAALGVRPGTVKSRLHRAKGRLAARLAPPPRVQEEQRDG